MTHGIQILAKNDLQEQQAAMLVKSLRWAKYDGPIRLFVRGATDLPVSLIKPFNIDLKQAPGIVPEMSKWQTYELSSFDKTLHLEPNMLCTGSLREVFHLDADLGLTQSLYYPNWRMKRGVHIANGWPWTLYCEEVMLLCGLDSVLYQPNIIFFRKTEPAKMFFDVCTREARNLNNKDFEQEHLCRAARLINADKKILDFRFNYGLVNHPSHNVQTVHDAMSLDIRLLHFAADNEPRMAAFAAEMDKKIFFTP